MSKGSIPLSRKESVAARLYEIADALSADCRTAVSAARALTREAGRLLEGTPQHAQIAYLKRYHFWF